MIETIILVIGVCLLNTLSFYLGARLGQKIVRNEEIKLPSPVKIVKELEQKKVQKAEVQKIEKIFANINNYDGTNNGQMPIE